MGLKIQLIKFTGWLGLFLISLCLAKLLSKEKRENKLLLFVRNNHKVFGWVSLIVLSVHGLLANNVLIPVMGRGKHLHLLETTGWGYLIWIMLFIICISSVLLPYKVFRKGHLQLVIVFGVLVFFHIV